MNLPQQLTGVYMVAFALWGLAGGYWPVAIAAAAALELPRILGRRFNVDERAYRLSWLLALLLVWMLAINGWLQLGRQEAVRNIMQWTPLAVYPLALASALAEVPGIPVSAFLLWLRQRYMRTSMGGVAAKVPRFDPFLPMLWLILLATSHFRPGAWFFPAAAALVAYVAIRVAYDSGRWRAGLLWTVVMAMFGLLLHAGILRFYRIVEAMVYGRIQGSSVQEINRTSTRIGAVDEIKSRKDVLWWVRYEDGAMPSYLYEATYDGFDANYGIWNNGDRGLRKFESIKPVVEAEPPTIWALAPIDGATLASGHQRVRGINDDDVVILPLPEGTVLIEDLPAVRMDRNGLGVVRANCINPVLDYRTTTLANDPACLAPDAARDLGLTPGARQIIAPIIRELDLAGSPPDAAVKKIAGFFARNFTYTRKINKIGLKTFLQNERRGHCEFFATASVLLLRSAGIPARYHTGFALVEYDGKKRTWRVRGTHAHAWASAWLNGRWQIIDNTPPDWSTDANEGPSLFQRLADTLREAFMVFQEWRTSRANGGWMAWFAPVSAVLATIYTVFRLLQGRKKSRLATLAKAGDWDYTNWPGQTRWLAILPAIERQHGPRPRYLPTLSWIDQIEEWPEEIRHAARVLARRHNQARFGARAPGGAEPESPEESRLKAYFLATNT